MTLWIIFGHLFSSLKTVYWYVNTDVHLQHFNCLSANLTFKAKFHTFGWTQTASVCRKPLNTLQVMSVFISYLVCCCVYQAPAVYIKAACLFSALLQFLIIHSSWWIFQKFSCSLHRKLLSYNKKCFVLFFFIFHGGSRFCRQRDGIYLQTEWESESRTHHNVLIQDNGYFMWCLI